MHNMLNLEAGGIQNQKVTSNSTRQPRTGLVFTETGQFTIGKRPGDVFLLKWPVNVGLYLNNRKKCGGPWLTHWY